MGYKLVYYSATHLAGFKSGLETNKVEIDFWKFLYNDNFIVVGGNGMGKSVLSSTLSPMPYPTDKRTKFIREGKEGMLERHYYSLDEKTLIICKNIYKPKSGGSHECKCYLRLVRNVYGPDYEMDDSIELNPNGNVGSYEELIKIYFGIDDNFLKLSSYNEDFKGLVKMTSNERHNAIKTIIPNTSRLLLAYENVNNKYKEVRTIMRSISDKISRIRPESTLEMELERIEKDLNKLTKNREDYQNKLSILKGRIKEIGKTSTDQDIFEYVSDLLSETRVLEKQLTHTEETLKIGRKKYGIGKSDDINAIIHRREKDLVLLNTSIQSEVKSYESKSDQLNILSDELNTLKAQIYSHNTFDIKELERLVASIKDEINSLEYTQEKDKYQNKDFSEANGFLAILNTLESGIQAIDFNNDGVLQDVLRNNTLIHCPDPIKFVYDKGELISATNKVNARLLDIDTELNNIKKELSDIYSFQRLEERLNLRPKECKIDSCPFIKDALSYIALKPRTKELEDMVASLENEESKLKLQLQYFNAINTACSSYETIRPILMNSSGLFSKYLNSSIKVYIDRYLKGTLSEYTQIAEENIKRQMEILSQKDHYFDLMTNKLPEMEKLLNQAQLDANILNTLNERVSVNNKAIKKIISEMDNIQFNMNHIKSIHEETSKEIEILKECATIKDSVDSLQITIQKNRDQLEFYSQRMESIKLYNKKIEMLEIEIKEIDDEFKPMMVRRDALKFEQLELMSLKQERAIVDRDFFIYDLIRGTIQPGKKIWKILSQIYMHDIQISANMLLEKTFDGNLYINDIDLEDGFIIPFTFNGYVSKDVIFASASQQTTISNCLSLAMLSILLNKYGIITLDEIDKDLSPTNKESFIKTITSHLKTIGIDQAFITTHNLSYYQSVDNVCYIVFPGCSSADSRIINKKENKDRIINIGA